MGANTKIEWAHDTFNPWRGCTKVSTGCDNCYASAMARRNPGTLGIWGRDGRRIVASEDYWQKPLKWNREAEQSGERRRVFCGSMMDVFEGPETMPAEAWPAVNTARFRLFDLIEQTPNLDWLLLTKRPENTWQNCYTPINWHVWPSNVWIGTSCENQEQADARIPHLLRVPARVRFLSCEPLLGAVNLSPWLHHCPSCAAPSGAYASCNYCEAYPDARGVSWVIVGGESGPGARPMHPQWARGLRQQCADAGVSFFMKQHGEWLEYGTDAAPGVIIQADRLPYHRFDDGTLVYRVGKKAAGRLLDGRTWDEVPG